jgi:Flp pilus assembly protein TadD
MRLPVWIALSLLALLSACTAATPRVGGAAPAKTEPEQPHLNPADMHADLIRQMLANGQYYAALAHIEDARRSGGNSEELDLLEADARSHLGQRPQAEALYRKLLLGRYAAQAYHGLGRLYVGTDLENAIRNLRAAVERAPTDVDFRNDLGYALMESGRYTEAKLQLSTAAELAPNQLTSRNNLIILMMLMGNEAAVQQLAQDSAATPERLRDLRQTAQSIREKQIARAAKPAG